MSNNDKDNDHAQEILSKSPRFTRVLTFLLVPSLLISILYLDFSTNADDQSKDDFALKWIYIFLVVGILWIVNVVSSSLAGFIPVIIIPILGIVNSKNLAVQFMSNSNMATYGVLILMVAIDNSGLRRRLTLTILRHTSGSIRWLYTYVFLVTTWFSMWLSSMGATYLMLHTIDDILESLKEEVANGAMGEERLLVLQKLQNIKKSKSQDEPKVGLDEPDSIPLENEISLEEPDEVLVIEEVFNVDASVNTEDELKLFENETQELLQNFGGELLYAVAVGANIGGNLWSHASITGMEMNTRAFTHTTTTSSNETVYVYRWTQASWMIYSLPLLLINAAVALKFLLWVNFSSCWIVGSKGKPRLCSCTQSELSLTKMKEAFSEKKDMLGPWTFQEKNIMFFATTLFVLCLTRSPLFIRGWSELLPNQGQPNSKKFIEMGDSAVYVLVALLLFLMPKYGAKICSGPKFPGDKIKRDGLIEWRTLQRKFPWAIPLLIGASRVIGIFSQTTVADRIANMISTTVRISDPYSIELLKLILMGQIILYSIFISNTGAVIVVLNVWSKLASTYEGMDKNLILGGSAVLPAFSVASLCFIIPTSSIPTAMVYKYKEKKNLPMSYFFLMGVPLTLCTLITTIAYALLWTPDTLMLR